MRVFFFEDLLRVSDGCFFFISFFFYMSICWKCLPEFVANIKNKRKGKKKKKKGCKAPRPGYTGLSAGSALRFFFDFFL